MTPPETRKLPITRDQATIMLQAIVNASSGIRQTDLAERTGLSQGTISEYLTIEHWGPSIRNKFISTALEKNLRKICGVLGLDFDTVYKNAVTKAPDTTTQALQRAALDTQFPPEVRQVADTVADRVIELIKQEAEIRITHILGDANPEVIDKAMVVLSIRAAAQVHNHEAVDELLRQVLGLNDESPRKPTSREK